MTEAINYAVPGALTTLDDVEPWALAGLPHDVVGICRPVPRLVVQPEDAKAAGLADERFAENQLRPAGQLVQVLLAMDATALVGGRVLERRVGKRGSRTVGAGSMPPTSGARHRNLGTGCATEDLSAIATVYAHADLPVPGTLIC